MKHLTRIAPILVVSALGIAACGGSDDGSDASLSGADAELADALADVWSDEESFPASLSSECLANGFITGIGGAEGAEGYGVTIDNIGERTFDENPLEQDDALAAAGEMYKCDGFKNAFLGEIADTEDADDTECLAGEISDEPLTGLFASTFMGDDAGELETQYEDTFEMEFFAALETCDIQA